MLLPFAEIQDILSPLQHAAPDPTAHMHCSSLLVKSPIQPTTTPYSISAIGLHPKVPTLIGDDLIEVALFLLGLDAATLPMLNRASTPSGRLALCLVPPLSVKADGSKTHMTLVCLGPVDVLTTSAIETEAVWGHKLL